MAATRRARVYTARATSELIREDQRCAMRLAAAAAPEGWESKSAAAALMPCASCCAALVPHL